MNNCVLLEEELIKKSQQKRRTSPSNFKVRVFVLTKSRLTYFEHRPGVCVLTPISFIDLIIKGNHQIPNNKTSNNLFTGITDIKKKRIPKGSIELSKIKCVETVKSDITIPCHYKYPFQIFHDSYLLYVFAPSQASCQKWVLTLKEGN
ncbi:hypothetical protein JD844_012337 [Phrynosoma platyrhinos]|uniref:PH domain-containing protein n=1 Tax=Phrynosoma platyrhinos TaxID=52577 RepID=A0ABQ7TJD1_PHRPL|nr:hypothetical protein JD844_012337 [Phrynosoma platyrhinos]